MDWRWRSKDSMNWGSGSREVLLDRFVFRRDGAKPFPENETTVRSSTCIGVPFRVCVALATPPTISRFYLEWPRGPKPEAGPMCQLVAAHRGCLLFRLISIVRSKTSPQYLLYPDDYFIYEPAAAAAAVDCLLSCSRPPLTRLPSWIKPKPVEGNKEKEAVAEEKEKKTEEKEKEAEEREADEKSDSDSSDFDLAAEMVPKKEREWMDALLRKEHEERMALGVDVEQEVVCSSLVVENVGLVCCAHGGGNEFVVAELRLDKSNHRLSAELSLFRSNGGGQWELKHLPVDYRKHRDATGMRCFWPQAVVPFGSSLCWVDYRRGMILGDVLEHSPKLSYVPFPPVAPSGREDMHRGVCATDGGSSLKFIDVVANDRSLNTFTIFTYTLKTTEAGRMGWDKDTATPMTAEELWGLEAPAPVPHEVPLFPLVSMEKPHVLHFLLSECTDYIDTVTLVTIDMNTRTVLSVHPYIKGSWSFTAKMLTWLRRSPVFCSLFSLLSSPSP